MKTAVITGSSRGIGRAVALRFAQDGYNITLNCTKSSRELHETLEAIQSLGTQAIAIQADVSAYKECEKLINAAQCHFGDIDVLVNNAGISHVGLFQAMSSATIAAVLNTNLLSAIYCAHLCVPGMIRSQQGCIINISSIWGNVGASCEAVYSSAKGGLNTFTKALAKELGPSGIRVNALSCGVIQTDMNAFLRPQEAANLTDTIPLSRFGTAQEVAAAAAFLASTQASYITGQILGVDGGII
ncbi:MAG: glucose 1-dehydrogenase [Defluviitaleaceae bacterium]|nr:glucose 1-dehydrogenase [Defluviitaleaceae bacterium]